MRRTGFFLVFFCLLCFFSSPLRADERDSVVTLLYTADVHGHVAANEVSLGLDVIAAVKAVTPAALLLDAGDFLHGTALAGISKGGDIVLLMQAAGYVAAAAGNHEFSHGREALEQALRAAEESGLAVLSSNVFKEDGALFFRPAVRLDIEGLAVCLFGISTQETAVQADPEAVRGLVFADAAEAGAAQARALRSQNCDLVVALVHLGSDNHSPLNSLEFARRVPGLDAVIDGHSHVVLDETVGSTRVVSAGQHAELLGRLTVRYDKERRVVTGTENSFLGKQETAALEPDAAVQARLEALQRKADALLSEVVGHSGVTLAGDKHTLRTREAGLGNFCADAVRHALGTDFALVNAGNIRSGVGKGPITRRTVKEILPFGNRVLSVPVTGRELLGILEHSLATLPETDGRFPQISGFRMSFDPEKAPGQRVRGVWLPDGAALDPDAAYTLGVSSFLAAGGDGYPYLLGKARPVDGPFEDEVFIRYLEFAGIDGYADGSPERIVAAPR